MKRFSTVNSTSLYKMLLIWKKMKRHATFFYLILLWTSLGISQISSGSHKIKYIIKHPCSHCLRVLKVSFTSSLHFCCSPVSIWHNPSSLLLSQFLTPHFLCSSFTLSTPPIFRRGQELMSWMSLSMEIWTLFLTLLSECSWAITGYHSSTAVHLNHILINSLGYLHNVQHWAPASYNKSCSIQTIPHFRKWYLQWCQSLKDTQPFVTCKATILLFNKWAQMIHPW